MEKDKIYIDKIYIENIIFELDRYSSILKNLECEIESLKGMMVRLLIAKD